MMYYDDPDYRQFEQDEAALRAELDQERREREAHELRDSIIDIMTPVLP